MEHERILLKVIGCAVAYKVMFNKLSSMALIQARLVLRDLTCLKEMLNGLINSTQKLQNIHDYREKNR